MTSASESRDFGQALSRPARSDAPAFSVDTHLFRELGELLVGRDSTALIELVKNAYDADATKTTLTGTQLESPDRGSIVVSDDGVGMTEREFRQGFLRVAARTKSTEARRSLLHERRYTGAKGIGRLAAHKLARTLEVVSVPHDRKREQEGDLTAYRIVASIDWDEVEKHVTLEDATAAITFRREPADGAMPGTTISLRKLRRTWSDLERTRLFDEMGTFQPPVILTDKLPSHIARHPLIFCRPEVRTAGPTGMTIDLEGELRSGEDPAVQFSNLASWVLEIDAKPDIVHYAIAPTQRFVADTENVPGEQQHEMSRDGAGPMIAFQARVLISTEQPPRALRETLRRTSGIRVYMEGFRVLPFGEPGDDWLEIQRAYVSRSRTLDLDGAGATDEGLVRPPVDQVFGAVFLTEDHAAGLRMLVNREGFVPDATFEDLRAVLKRGIDLATRARAQATVARRRARSTQRRSGVVDRANRERSSADRLTEGLGDASTAAQEASVALREGDAQGAAQRLVTLTATLEASRAAGAELISEGAMLRVLASLGTQMAEFVHELNGILGSANAVDELARDLRADRPPTPSEVRDVAEAVGDLRLALERQAAFLVDVLTPDARRRRTRQSFAERFTAAARLVADPAARHAITISNEIPEGLRSPAMFPAEILAVFLNLLTNGVKAAGEGGVVRATGDSTGALTRIRLENTGVRVDPGNAERWFAPFASSTANVDSVLGQGMGLGLSLTRAMLSGYRASVNFVKPTKGFATAIEVTFPR